MCSGRPTALACARKRCAGSPWTVDSPRGAWVVVTRQRTTYRSSARSRPSACAESFPPLQWKATGIGVVTVSVGTGELVVNASFVIRGPSRCEQEVGEPVQVPQQRW